MQVAQPVPNLALTRWVGDIVMKLSEQASARILAREEEERINACNRSANARKREVYWIGFLEGTLASRRIEPGEEDALLVEAEKFVEFFEDDADAADLAADLHARCFESEQDLIGQLGVVISEKRDAVMADASYSETDEMNEFLGFCGGIICDGKILQPEAAAIRQRFRRSEVLMNAATFQSLRRAVERAMADRILTDDEAKELREWIAALVGDGFVDTGLANIGTVAQLDDPILDPEQVRVKGATFVLTGPMRMGPRAFIIGEIERAGGIVEPRTTQRTDYLVISSKASRHWRTTHFGTKIERAKELINAGHPMRFVCESALESAIAANVAAE